MKNVSGLHPFGAVRGSLTQDCRPVLLPVVALPLIYNDLFIERMEPFYSERTVPWLHYVIDLFSASFHGHIKIIGGEAAFLCNTFAECQFSHIVVT